MSTFTAQGSITIKRLRTGTTISLALNTGSNPLQQFVALDSGVVTPDWTIDDNRPIVTPQASASSGTVTIEDGQWSYNGVALVFNGSQEGSYILDSTGKFGLDVSTWALKVMANLASSVNYASDILTFSCNCVVAGVEYAMTRSVEIVIMQSTAGSYAGWLGTDAKVLDLDTTTSNIYATLFDGTSYVQDFTVDWYRNYVSDNNFIKSTSSSSGKATLSVTRDDVNGGDNNDSTGGGGTLFIAQFFLSGDTSSPVATAGITIADEADAYSLVFAITSDNKELDTDKPVTAEASLVDSSGAKASVSVKSCTLSVLNNDMTVKRSVSGTSITVTMDDSDDADVNVVGEIDYEL